MNNTRKRQSSFPCLHCNQTISNNGAIGTHHRNHCPFCLWSKHVDEVKSGDRKSLCQSAMEPIGLTFKHEGTDKYGDVRQGEVMVVHRCTECGKITINRIAGDDNEKVILSLLTQESLTEKTSKESRHLNDVDYLTERDKPEVQKQLFGIDTSRTK